MPQDDDAQEDGMSKAEVLQVLQGHMDDIKACISRIPHLLSHPYSPVSSV